MEEKRQGRLRDGDERKEARGGARRGDEGKDDEGRGAERRRKAKAEAAVEGEQTEAEQIAALERQRSLEEYNVVQAMMEEEEEALGEMKVEAEATLAPQRERTAQEERVVREEPAKRERRAPIRLPQPSDAEPEAPEVGDRDLCPTALAVWLATDAPHARVRRAAGG